MSQLLHIFAKDSRRLRWEIAISVALTAAFAWIYPSQWHQGGLHGFTGIGAIAFDQNQFLATILTILIPVSWWILITRVVHAESLVGDRQFWLTRPYEWPKLLAAKALFVLAYVFLPILMAQFLLLAQAGFPPFAYGSGLAYNLMLLGVIVALPLASLAVVTSSFARLTLTILGIFVSLIAIFSVLARFEGAHLEVNVPGQTAFLLPLMFLACGAAVVLQYATRRVWVARLLLIALPIVSVAILALLPVDALMDRAYPATAKAPVQLSLHQESTHHLVVTKMFGGKKEVVQITLPIQVGGIQEGDLLTPSDVRLSIELTKGESANGFVWNSSWQPVTAMHFGDAAQDAGFNFPMEQAVFDRVKGQPVTLRLKIAFAEAKAAGVQRVPMPDHDFSVPDFGVCSPEVIVEPSQPMRITGIRCRSALRQPVLTYVDALWSNDACSGDPTNPAQGVQGSAWVGYLDPDPAQFGITSVWNTPVPLTNGWVNDTSRDGRPMKPRHLCPGTPLVFTRYMQVGRFQTELAIPDFQMPEEASPIAASIQIEER
jgi:hypothetical protein